MTWVDELLMIQYGKYLDDKKEQDRLIRLADDFDTWLVEMAEKYGMHKDDVQERIKEFLM